MNSVMKRSAGVEELIVLLNILTVALMVSGLKGMANYISFAALIFMLWVAVKHFDIPVKQSLKYFVVFILYYAATSVINLNAEYFATYAAYYVLAFSPIFIYNIMENIDEKYSRFTLRWSMVIWGLMTLYSIGFYIVNPMAARERAADRNMFSGELFGGYLFVYGSAILCVYCFSLIFDKRLEKDTKKKRYLILAVAILFVLVFMTNSTITTFATILGIGFTLIFGRILKKKGSRPKKIFKISLAFAAVFAVYLIVMLNIDAILAWLAQRNDVFFFKRLEELINGLFFDNTTAHYEKREDTLTASIQIFLENPIFGAGYRYGNVFSEGTALGIGNHSELLDTFARYGVIGSVPMIATYFCCMKDYCKRHLGVLLTFAILVIFNPFISYQSNFILFLAIPLCEKILSKRVESDLNGTL